MVPPARIRGRNLQRVRDASVRLLAGSNGVDRTGRAYRRSPAYQSFWAAYPIECHANQEMQRSRSDTVHLRSVFYNRNSAALCQETRKTRACARPQLTALGADGSCRSGPRPAPSLPAFAASTTIPGSSPASCRVPTSPDCRNLGGASARAGLEGVRIHDLRHTFASRALALGETLPVIGKLLGHSDIETTARYAHLARDSILDAAEQIAGSIATDIL